MGDCVGELVYGLNISDEQYKNLLQHQELLDSSDDYGFGPYFNHDKEVFPYQPYETDTYLIIVRKSIQVTADSSIKVKSIDEAQVRQWYAMIKDFCVKYNVEVMDDEIGWYLLGHYN